MQEITYYHNFPVAMFANNYYDFINIYVNKYFCV